ncbi:hypothetical protein F4801DRAFT_335247 [Xylaria longipes]|nr:hypothetical protein F4801DRAFT_335247 [Xylaria longipes]RYC62538.1 hypothetical protein CHU98_g3701 [Xylaria longipes]
MEPSAMASQMGVVPAQLGFLAIFNPSLGATDETLDDQIVYYASVGTQSQKRRHRSRGKPTADISQEERNERLRQIGLAQGMVEFSRGFADGEPVNTIETEKTRVVLQEVEPGWWILASIDLTRIPLPPRIGSPTPGKTDEQPDNVEYSSRELKSSTLLMRDLIRAHSVFLLHHASSLSALFVRSRRSNFIKILSRFWDLFLSTWDVMLHGNPASNIFRGIKIAASGELGVGVGEEDRGSGEREVLEGFVGRVEGLTDLVVSRFGSSESASEVEPAKDGMADTSSAQWLGTGEEPGAEDGAIFLGVGALSRKSLRDITYWMEDIYTWGESAYGVKDSPTSTRQTRRRRKSIPVATGGSGSQPQPSDRTTPPGHGSSTRGSASDEHDRPEPTESAQDEGAADEGGMNKFMSYLKMGYGTHWSLGSSEDGQRSGTLTKEDGQPAKVNDPTSHKPLDAGHYLIGLLGDMEESDVDEGERGNQPDNETQTSEYNSRIPLRTLTVELDSEEQTEAQQVEDLGSQSTELTLTRSGNKDLTNPNSQFDSQDRNKTQKMRVVVYVNKPFIFTFLFRNRTDSLAWEGLYRSLHHQLAPLRKPLATSTAYRPIKPDVGEKASHIFDLVWDPKAMTVHSTIPSIPTLVEMLREDAAPVWSRAEAVNTHNQILNMYAATLSDYSELERTCKTSRGWWVVWTRILERDTTPTEAENTSEGHPSSDRVVPTLRQTESQENDNHRAHPTVSKEIFLVRRAGEHTGLRGIGSGSYADNAGGSWAEGASRLAQGIGVDTHKYIEGLLSLGR